MLIIKAKGGLGNRILSTSTFILYAKLTQRTFRVDWNDGIYANIGENAYDVLFEQSFSNQLDNLNNQRSLIIPSIWNGNLDQPVSYMIKKFFPTQHSNPWIYRKLSAPLTWEKPENLEVVWSYTRKLGRIKKFSSTPATIVSDFRDVLLQYFCPKQSLEERINAFINSMPKKVLGVHIRYTDLKVPYNKILRNIEKCLNENEYQAIFLSTDNQQVQDEIRAKFSNVFTTDKRFGQHNQQLHLPNHSTSKISDAESALMEIFILSQCDALVYSSRSSFARLSVLLGSFEEKALFDVDRFHLKTQCKNVIQEYL